MAGRGEEDRTDVRDRGSEVQSLQEYHRTSLDFPGKKSVISAIFVSSSREIVLHHL